MGFPRDCACMEDFGYGREQSVMESSTITPLWHQHIAVFGRGLSWCILQNNVNVIPKSSTVMVIRSAVLLLRTVCCSVMHPLHVAA